MEPGKEHILAGDVGGTKIILALAEVNDTGVAFLHKKRMQSGRYVSLEEAALEFLEEVDIDRGETLACLGVAGPVKNGACKATNLPWLVNADKLRKRLGLAKVELINDFKSIAYGIPCLGENDIDTLNEGYRDEKGPIAIIGAGTGLGEGLAFYSPSGRGYRVLPSEGGHSTFSPTNDDEIGLLRYLMERYGHVSFERVLSGQGLVNIYSYLVDSGCDEVSRETTEAMISGDPAAVISSLAVSGRDGLCERALDMFVAIYGTEAGNLALKFLPSGGLYIGGGMAPRIREKLKEGAFMRSFLNKGRLSAFLENIPVYIILNEEVGLMGAAMRGRELLSQLREGRS